MMRVVSRAVWVAVKIDGKNAGSRAVNWVEWMVGCWSETMTETMAGSRACWVTVKAVVARAALRAVNWVN